MGNVCAAWSFPVVASAHYRERLLVDIAVHVCVRVYFSVQSLRDIRLERGGGGVRCFRTSDTETVSFSVHDGVGAVRIGGRHLDKSTGWAQEAWKENWRRSAFFAFFAVSLESYNSLIRLRARDKMYEQFTFVKVCWHCAEALCHSPWVLSIEKLWFFCSELTRVTEPWNKHFTFHDTENVKFAQGWWSLSNRSNLQRCFEWPRSNPARNHRHTR